MTKGVKLTAAALLMATGSWAQAPVDSLTVFDDSDFTFTESQLDEDNDAAQTVSTITSSKNDLYRSEVGYLFSPMRFKVRGYDNRYENMHMNGMQLNDVEGGRFSYGMIGGLNDATRNKEGVSAFEYNNFCTPGIGGATQINTRASQFATGNKLTISGCNRNYVARGMFTTATGLMSNGWALAASIGYRWANRGAIEGTFYNAFSYLLSAEKRFNEHHSLSLVTWGAPTERGQQGASTEEVYWLTNNHQYNPNWGYQDGKRRNSRVVKSFEPTAILTWDWKNDNMKLVTAAAFKYSKYGTTALGWNGNAYDPRPDYYKNLPSSVFDVYNMGDEHQNTPEYLKEHPYFLEEYNELKDYWMSSKANQQINWDRMYFINRQNNELGGDALYYQERRNNDQMMAAFNSTFSHSLNKNSKYSAGVQYSFTKGMHYKTMEDLLGANKYTDVDKFAAKDYGMNSEMAQNDLRNPNRLIGEGDKFGYNYNIFVHKANAWTQYQYNAKHISFGVGGNIDGTAMEREGLMQNGRAKENSYGRSGVATFLGGGGKASFSWRPNAFNRITLSAVYQSQAPLARNSFVAPRLHNNYVNGLENEDIISADVLYSFRAGNLTGQIGGYYTKFMHQTEQTAYYNDQVNTFTYMSMNGIEKEHFGLEFAFNYQATNNLSFYFIGNIGDAKYTNNPNAQINYEGLEASTNQKINTCINPVTKEKMPLHVIADGMRVSGTPLTALSWGVDYNTHGWFLGLNLNYYGRVYVGFSQYRRLNSTYNQDGQFYTPSAVDANGRLVYDVTEADLNERGGILFDEKGNQVRAYAAKQEKFNNGLMLDASVGKYIRLKKGKSLSINLSVQNITNNRNMRTGGYEQNRSDNYYNQDGGQYTKGEGKGYKFTKNSKYYYANPINAFLNIGFKF